MAGVVRGLPSDEEEYTARDPKGNTGNSTRSMKTIFAILILTVVAFGQEIKSSTWPTGTTYSTFSDGTTIKPTGTFTFSTSTLTSAYIVILSPTVGGGMKIKDSDGTVVAEVMPDGKIVGDSVRALRILAKALSFNVTTSEQPTKN